MRSRCASRWLLASFLLLGIVVAPLAAQVTTSPREDLRRQAVAAEQRRDWNAAASFYESMLRKDRTSSEVRTAYVRALRHLHLSRRHSDPSFAAVVQQMAPSQALDVYQQVLRIIPSVYVDQLRATFAARVGLDQHPLRSSGCQPLIP